MALAAGSKAPDFTLINQDKQPVTMSQTLAKGPVVLAFFPAAFTGVCTKELCTFRDSMAQLNTANASVFGISVDMPFSLKVFADQQRLNFPLLSDFNKEAIKAYDVIWPDLVGMKNVASRAVFVIDRQGVIRYAEVTANPGVEPDYGKVLGAVAAL